MDEGLRFRVEGLRVGVTGLGFAGREWKTKSRIRQFLGLLAGKVLYPKGPDPNTSVLEPKCH